MSLYINTLFTLVVLTFATPCYADAKAQKKTIPQGEVTILAVGDSLTEGYQVPESDSYPSVLQRLLSKKLSKTVKVINGGVSGATTASGLRRLNWYMKGKSKPTILILALGANDGLRGLPVKNSERNLAQTIEKAKQYGMTVILAGMQIPPNYGESYAKEFKKIYPRLAKQYGVALIPFLLEGVAAQPKLNLPDGIHPNAEGYQIVATNVLPYVEGAL